jgi:hypothetical protein
VKCQHKGLLSAKIASYSCKYSTQSIVKAKINYIKKFHKIENEPHANQTKAVNPQILKSRQSQKFSVLIAILEQQLRKLRLS